ncbi:MAG: hypothetical protein OXC82_14345 [Rhodobacteraceae bacterium]|nr:hypothetical protein [Paracoccaceae bacterium]MCY4251598.1 hypothetical protein [Paracoccaceae bacterium]MCY4308379.1 hypothetical protein [Paracoccaceae bacterium]
MGAWTTQQVNKAVNMWKEGKTATEISNKISKSRNAVIGKLNRLGVKKPNSDAANEASSNKDENKATDDKVDERLNGRSTGDLRGAQLEDQRLSLLYLNEKTCRWPIGDPSTKNFWFCGKPTLLNKRYCAQHSELAFQPNPVKKEKSELQARVISRPYTLAPK